MMNSSENRFDGSRMTWKVNMDTSMDKYRTSPVEDNSPQHNELSNSPKSFQEDPGLLHSSHLSNSTPLGGGKLGSGSLLDSRGSPLMDDQCRRYRTNYSRNQIARLEEEFRREKYLSRPRRCELASELGLKENTIKVWFQNRRMKEKRQITSLALPVFANADPNLYAFLMESANAYMTYTASNGGIPPPSGAPQPLSNSSPCSVAAPPTSTINTTNEIPSAPTITTAAPSALYSVYPPATGFPARQHGASMAVPPPTSYLGGPLHHPNTGSGYEAHLRLAMEQLNAQLEQQSQLYAALQHQSPHHHHSNMPLMAGLNSHHSSSAPNLFERAFLPCSLPAAAMFARQSLPTSVSPPLHHHSNGVDHQEQEPPLKLKIAESTGVESSSPKMKLFRPFILADDN